MGTKDLFESQFIPRFAHLFLLVALGAAAFVSYPAKDSFSSIPSAQVCLWCPWGAMHLLRSQVRTFFPQMLASELGCTGRASHSQTLNSQAWRLGEFCFRGWYCPCCFKKKQTHINDELEIGCMFPLQQTGTPKNWRGGKKSNVIPKRQ